MKKINQLILCSLIFCSCAPIQAPIQVTTTTTELVGDITTYNEDGSVLKKWEDIVIERESESIDDSGYKLNESYENSFKSNGLNFYDSKSNKFVIISNTTPYIIEYKINKSVVKNNINVEFMQDSPKQELSDEEKEQILNEYNQLKDDLKSIRANLKSRDKNTKTYEEFKQRKRIVSGKIKKLEQIMYIENIKY